METKSLVESKVFWFAVLKFAAGAIAAFSAAFGALIPASVAGALLMVTSIIDMILRTQTEIPVGSILPRK